MRLKGVFRWLKRALLLGLGVLLILLATGAFWHWRETRKTEERYPPPGRFVDLGTHRLHYDVEGNGTPVVVMDNGILGASWGLEPIQDEVAKFTTVCTFDRAGHAWSDTGPKPRNPKTIVEELRKMLRKAELEPPYVLAGFSLGGLHMRYFASTYPDEVAGLILAEAVNTDVLPGNLEHPFGGRPAAAMLLYPTLHFGSARFIYPRFFSKLDIAQDKDIFQKWLAFNCRTKDVLAVRDEYDAMAQWRDVRDQMQYLGSMPVTVLSAKHGYAPYDWWGDAQKALGSIADDVEMIEVDCSHGIAFQRPDVVARAVQDTVDRIRVQEASRNADSPPGEDG